MRETRPVATTTKSKKAVAPVSRERQVSEVLDLINEGMPEAAACRQVGINRNTFRAAALKHQVADIYARALETLATEQINQIEQTLSDMRNGIIDSNMARVEVDTRKWFASKFLPRKYGDKLDLTSDGKELPAPILGIVQTSSPEADERVEVENQATQAPSELKPGNILEDIQPA